MLRFYAGYLPVFLEIDVILVRFGLWEPYSGGLMVPAQELGDTCRHFREQNP